MSTEDLTAEGAGKVEESFALVSAGGGVVSFVSPVLGVAVSEVAAATALSVDSAVSAALPLLANTLALLIAVADTRREEAKSPETSLDLTTGTFLLLSDAFNLATRSGEMTGRREGVAAPPGEALVAMPTPPITSRDLHGVDFLAPLPPMSSVFILSINVSTDCDWRRIVWLLFL